MPLKLNTQILSQFPFKALSEHHLSLFGAHKSVLPTRMAGVFDRTLRVIDAFLYSTKTKLTLKTFNSQTAINVFLQEIIIFIYQRLDGSLLHRYNYSSYVMKLLGSIAKGSSVSLQKIALSKNKVNPEIQPYIYTPLDIDEHRLSFYKGWVVVDNKGGSIDVELSYIREAYGESATDKIFEAFKKFARANKRNTVFTHLKHLRGLFSFFIKLTPSFHKLESLLNHRDAVKYLALIFSVELKRHIDSGMSGRAFCWAWRDKMGLYSDCLVRHGVFKEPLHPLPKPKFKQLKEVNGTNNRVSEINDESSGIFNHKLLTNIPLQLTDDHAISEIVKDVRRDISHVAYVCDKAIEHNYKRLKKFQEYSKQVLPKEYAEVRDYSSLLERDYVACATFARYLWNPPVKTGGYASFLGYRDKTPYLTKLLCIPTLHILYPLLLRLVYEHPVITESWFLNWQLYDENGNCSGVINSGKSTLIRSVKMRRGMHLAEQVIKLTEVSERVVKLLLEHTDLARRYLRAKGDDNYRFVLIGAKFGSQPSRVESLTNLKKIKADSFFTRLLKSSSPYVSSDRATSIFRAISINRMRASAGVEVFLKTNSVRKMCDALGHKEPRPDLVSVYLPEPILKFFKDRWIRIFQNAIVFEAMKDSAFLYEAIDLTSESLAEFLKNHKLPKMDGHLWDGNVFKEKSSSLDNSEGVIVLSKTLLRILIFILNARTEDLSKIGLEPDTLQTWIELATLIITQLEFQICSENAHQHEFDEDVLVLFREALDEPLSLKNFMSEDSNERV